MATNSRNDYDATGGDTFGITFDFDSDKTSEIIVRVASVLKVEGAGNDYLIVGTNVVFNSTKEPTSGDRVKVKRQTDLSVLADFLAKPSLSQDELQAVYTQLLRLSQEQRQDDVDELYDVLEGDPEAGQIRYFDLVTKKWTLGTFTDIAEHGIPANLGGDIILPNITIDNALLRSNGVDGLAYKATGITVSDDDDLSGVRDLNASRDVAAAGAVTGSTISASGTVSAVGDVLAGANVQLTGNLNDANDNELIKTTQVASAVNEVTVSNAATGNAPSIAATGDDANINLELKAKGTGSIKIPASFELDVDNATDSTSISTGAIKTDGGLGVAKSLYVGESLNLSNSNAGQIEFPATQNPSANVNTLDDYEEGTFTPVLWDTSLSDGEGQTYAAQVGVYTKIGNTVFIKLYLVVSSIGTLTGTQQARIGGLPFTSGSLANSYSSFSCGYGASLSLPTAGDVPSGFLTNNGTNIALWNWTAAAGSIALSVTQWSNNGTIIMSGHYTI